MAHQVFISYANEKGTGNNRDSLAAEEIYNALEAKDIRCWMASRDLKGGDDWPEKIPRAVKESRLVVLVFSSNANKSQWVKNEITLAMDRNITIIPFRIENVPPTGVLEIVMIRYQCIDAFQGQLQDYIDKLVKDVQEHLETVPGRADKTLEVNKQPQPLKEKIQEPDDRPEDAKAVQSKCKEVYRNKNGFWEADYGDGIIMVYIPPGEFTMGSNDYDDNEKPLHTVFLDGYWMGKTGVTVEQFRLFVEDERYITGAEKMGWVITRVGGKFEKKEGITWKNPGFRQDDNHPVVCVSWDDARAYCKWLSHKKGLSFKLSTEAQWEKASRGTDKREYPWGDQVPDKDLANFASNIGKTTPVGSYPDGASPYGLLDMAGNVWEWCNDWYKSDYYKKSPTKNPPGPESDSKRVQRSGSWNYDAGYLRCAFRGNGTSSLCSPHVGFRLCQDNH